MHFIVQNFFFVFLNCYECKFLSLQKHTQSSMRYTHSRHNPAMKTYKKFLVQINLKIEGMMSICENTSLVNQCIDCLPVLELPGQAVFKFSLSFGPKFSFTLDTKHKTTTALSYHWSGRKLPLV